MENLSFKEYYQLFLEVFYLFNLFIYFFFNNFFFFNHLLLLFSFCQIVTLLLSFSLSCILVIFYKTLTISFTEEFIGRLNQEIDLITVARLCFISIFIYIALSIYTSRSKKFSFIQQIDQSNFFLLNFFENKKK